jgi:aldose 1-epimerase
VRLVGADVEIALAPASGGRIASLRLFGAERLRQRGTGPGPLQWGCYPMVPWGGRLRHGRFRAGGAAHRLPANLGAHAIHGTGTDRAWRVGDDGALRLALGPPWPFGGTAVHRVELGRTSVRCVLEVHAGPVPMPAQAGWHPWFVRPVELEFAPGPMYRRDDEGIPDGTLVTAAPGPWDDCFSGVAAPPRLHFADGLVVAVESSCSHWVVYDEPEDAICVEPMTGPPDGFNLAPVLVSPGDPLVAELVLRW